MIKVPVYSMDGKLLEELEVDEAVLGGKVCADVLRQAILTYEANQRAGTAKTKTRAEKAYSGRKPWRQKHTGHARAGSRASPIWVGGGKAHGPVPRDYSQKLNKKMRQKALASALLAKLQDAEVKILDKLELPEAKTKEMVRVLSNIGVERTFLLVVAQNDPALWRCTRNIAGAAMTPAGELNPYELVRARTVVFTREAFDSTLAASAQEAASPAQ